MCKRLWTIGTVSGLLLLLIGLPAAAAEKEATFDMQEVSVFEEGMPDQPGYSGFVQGGQYVSCSFERDDQVKRYPELKSDRPVYGSVAFDQNRVNPDAGMRFHFVVDESGDGQSGEAKTDESQSLLRSLVVALVGDTDTTARKGTDVKYDRLYFDANRDLDLTNDPVVARMKNPPSRLTSSREVVFDYLNVGFDYGPELGTRPLKIIPRLRVSGQTRAYMIFTAAVVRKGKIKIGDQEYMALLTQSGMITGRFDRPYTELHLAPVDSPGKRIRQWWGEGYLGAMRQVDGTLYAISATPTGDRLTVGPYRGQSGVFKIGPGGREIEKLGASGVLVSEEALVPVGNVTVPSPAEKSPEHKIPVGDYVPMYMSVDFGRLVISLSQNYYSQDEPHDRVPKPPVCTFRIRQHKPFVLDFSNKPSVLFTRPAKDETFKPGDSVKIGAVIIDPVLDILLRDLEDTTQKVGERTYTGEEGNKVTIPRYASLDPTVVVTDSSGKQVAEGKMPFG